MQQDCEEIFARCESVIGHDGWEFWFFVGLSVMRIVYCSESHAVAAPISKARVGELVRGLFRRIRTGGSTLASGRFPELIRVLLQARDSRRQVLPCRRLASRDKLHTWPGNLIGGASSTRVSQSVRLGNLHFLIHSQSLSILQACPRLSLVLLSET